MKMLKKRTGETMDNYNNENKDEHKQQRAHSEGYKAAHKKTFAQRNKYRIRQVCGVLVLVAVIGGSVMMLTKCGGNEISDADSKLTVVTQPSQSETSSSSEAQTTGDTTTQSSDTENTEPSSKQTDETSDTPSQTSETSETTQDTTEQTTASTTQKQTTKRTTTTTSASQETTGSEQQTTSKQTSVSKTTTQQTTSESVGPANVQKKNGVTYVNGILIANKTYALPSNYVPNLVPIGNYQYLDPNAAAAFQKMQQAAALEGISLFVCSGYRSYSTQQYLYNSYAARDGYAAADRYSARPGYSEHQTGLAADINMASSYFDNTPEAKWLAKHCSDYGFIIRYKKGKESSTGYMPESWHIRYLGNVKLCKQIEASGLSLEEYLGITSKYKS